MKQGRILHHLANNIGNPKNTVLLWAIARNIRWAARSWTDGRRFPSWASSTPSGARIREMDSFSGHADHGELGVFRQDRRAQEEYHSAHGEEGLLALAEALRKRRPIRFHRGWEAPWC
ncbi:MAG: hypothetical protein ACLT8E_00260 [Akkermansia sp.]